MADPKITLFPSQLRTSRTRYDTYSYATASCGLVECCGEVIECLSLWGAASSNNIL